MQVWGQNLLHNLQILCFMSSWPLNSVWFTGRNMPFGDWHLIPQRAGGPNGKVARTMTVISDISAWQYWRTPPVLRNVEIDEQTASAPVPLGAGLDSSLFCLRANAREIDRVVHGHILTDLKGATLPLHVMVEEGPYRFKPNELTVAHCLPEGLPGGSFVSLGGDLEVLSPEATICSLSHSLSAVQLAKVICEACGIFTLAPQNERIKLVLRKMRDEDLLNKETFGSDGIFGFSDDMGRPLNFTDQWGNPLEWTPCFDRRGQYTGLWKRPPLTSIENLELYLNSYGKFGPRHRIWKALAMSANGAASPAEVFAYLLLCSGAWNGGESWGKPDLNRRVVYTRKAAKLAHGSFCIGDMLWIEQKKDLEIQSDSYHADKLGYRLYSGRTSALEAMGFTVKELLYEQMADLELFDSVLPALAKALDQPLQPRSVAFLRRRNELHKQLFDAPYEPCV